MEREQAGAGDYGYDLVHEDMAAPSGASNQQISVAGTTNLRSSTR